MSHFVIKSSHFVITLALWNEKADEFFKLLSHFVVMYYNESNMKPHPLLTPKITFSCA